MHLPPPTQIPFFSIVIPLYNNEKVFHECLDSLIMQSFTDFEAIIVDDGSTDKSRIIAENFQAKDSRIKVIVQNNQGALVARNNGVNSATGKYLIFVDSDDIIAPEALQVIHDILVAEKSDILQYPISRFMDGDEPDRFPVHAGKCIHPSRMELIGLLLDYRIPSLCTKAIRRNVYSAIPLPEQRLNIGEDYYSVFSLITMDLRWCIMETDKPVYLYRQYPSAGISRRRLEELSTFDDVCYIRSVMLEYFKSVNAGDDLMKKFCDNFMISSLENIFYMAKAGKGTAHLKKECRKLFESEIYKFASNRKDLLSDSGIKWRFEYCLLRWKMLFVLYMINKVFICFC